MIPKFVQICNSLLRSDFGMVNIQIRKKPISDIFVSFFISFPTSQILLQYNTWFECYIQITETCSFWILSKNNEFLPTSLSLNSKLIKSEFANFVIILEFDEFSSKTCKIQENTKTTQNIKL
jgi:hypothetical protein